MTKKTEQKNASAIYVSVVVPVYNEEESLQKLSDRLMPVLEALGRPYEVIYTNDGSKDRSFEILQALHKRYPDKVRVIDFLGNYGQHMAIMAAFEQARGSVVVNLDADLQNPPEEIPKLLEKFDAGHDYVGGYRAGVRKDNIFRTWGSKLANYVRSKLTRVTIHDQGCMFRAYSQDIVRAIASGKEHNTFITVLGAKYASNPCEVGLRHDERDQGESKYGLYELARVWFDLLTGFSLVPLQLFTFFGMGVSVLSFLLVIYMVLRRLIIGPEAEGLFTLMAILIFLVSVAIFGIGLIGEYLGRTFQAVNGRPRYLVRTILGEHHHTNVNE